MFSFSRIRVLSFLLDNCGCPVFALLAMTPSFALFVFGKCCSVHCSTRFKLFVNGKNFIECFHFPVLGHFPLCSVKLNMPIMFCLLAVTPPKLRLILESTLFLWTFSLLGQISGGAPNNQ